MTLPHLADAPSDGEWCTPPQYIERARRAMGGITLDPASNEMAQSYIQARIAYTAEDDGLIHPWHGNVWLNPPSTRGLTKSFIDKLLASPDVDRAIILTNNTTDTQWAQRLWESPNTLLLCFSKGRVPFLHPTKVGRTIPPRGQVFTAYGPCMDVNAFLASFADVGLFAKPWGQYLDDDR